MGIPKVAIVGRPNVGKSSLFNWLVGRRLAIVDPTSGVTRDRMTHLVEIKDRYIELIDTGGMGVKDCDNLTEDVENQIQLALESADLVLFVVDTRDGITSLDEHVSRKLRPLDVPILCVANKADHDGLVRQSDEFYRFGRKILAVSVQQNRGKSMLLDEIYNRLPPPEREDPNEEPEMKIAIVGRRNVGKSTFINTLANAPRMIVSSVPGTTRDSVDVQFELDGKKFVAIDTPGFRKRKSVTTNIDFYGTHRAERSIRRADVVLLFFDCTQRISQIEKQLCDYIINEHKPCIFVVNKWDLVPPGVPFERWVHYLRDTFRTLHYAPIAFITGETGKNVRALLSHAKMLFKQSRSRIGTGELNRLVQAALEHNPPPMRQNRRPKVYYGAQVSIAPPTIALFCNNPKLFDNTYKRYLLSILRDYLPYPEVPIKLYLRSRGDSDNTNEIDKKIAPTEQGRFEPKPLPMPTIGQFYQQQEEEFGINYEDPQEVQEESTENPEEKQLIAKGPKNGQTVFHGDRIEPEHAMDFIDDAAIEEDDGQDFDDEDFDDEDFEGKE